MQAQGKARAGSQPTVEASESVGKIKRHDQHACADCEDVLPVEQIEAAYVAYEQVGNGQVEESPEDIDS